MEVVFRHRLFKVPPLPGRNRSLHRRPIADVQLWQTILLQHDALLDSFRQQPFHGDRCRRVESACSIADLPPEVLCHIVSFLGVLADVRTCLFVSHAFHDVALEPAHIMRLCRTGTWGSVCAAGNLRALDFMLANYPLSVPLRQATWAGLINPDDDDDVDPAAIARNAKNDRAPRPVSNRQTRAAVERMWRLCFYTAAVAGHAHVLEWLRTHATHHGLDWPVCAPFWICSAIAASLLGHSGVVEWLSRTANLPKVGQRPSMRRVPANVYIHLLQLSADFCPVVDRRRVVEQIERLSGISMEAAMDVLCLDARTFVLPDDSRRDAVAIAAAALDRLEQQRAMGGDLLRALIMSACIEFEDRCGVFSLGLAPCDSVDRHSGGTMAQRQTPLTVTVDGRRNDGRHQRFLDELAVAFFCRVRVPLIDDLIASSAADVGAQRIAARYHGSRHVAERDAIARYCFRMGRADVGRLLDTESHVHDCKMLAIEGAARWGDMDTIRWASGGHVMLWFQCTNAVALAFLGQHHGIVRLLCALARMRTRRLVWVPRDRRCAVPHPVTPLYAAVRMRDQEMVAALLQEPNQCILASSREVEQTIREAAYDALALGDSDALVQLRKRAPCIVDRAWEDRRCDPLCLVTRTNFRSIYP